jgi:hypothetical protein
MARSGFLFRSRTASPGVALSMAVAGLAAFSHEATQAAQAWPPARVS